MSFAVSASATRVVASARAPIKAQRASAAAAFAAPASKTNSAARLSMRSVADAVALRADKSVAARAGPRGNLAVFAGRFETERTYIMIKPDGVQRGYVRSHARLSAAIATAGFSPAARLSSRDASSDACLVPDARNARAFHRPPRCTHTDVV